jgi:hypothetical protein
MNFCTLICTNCATAQCARRGAGRAGSAADNNPSSSPLFAHVLTPPAPRAQPRGEPPREGRVHVRLDAGGGGQAASRRQRGAFQTAAQRRTVACVRRLPRAAHAACTAAGGTAEVPGGLQGGAAGRGVRGRRAQRCVRHRALSPDTSLLAGTRWPSRPLCAPCTWKTNTPPLPRRRRAPRWCGKAAGDAHAQRHARGCADCVCAAAQPPRPTSAPVPAASRLSASFDAFSGPDTLVRA